jgi:hypothetical protein
MTLATSQTGQIQTLASLDGVSTNSTVNPAGNTVQKPIGALPAGSYGQLTTHSSSTAGVFTFSAPANLQGTEMLAIFWADGTYITDIPNTDWSITAGTAGAATAITITALPGSQTLDALNTYGIVAPAQNVTNSVSIVGSDAQMLLITSTQPGLCELLAGGTVELTAVIVTANGFYSWPQYSGQTNPISGSTITVARMYNNSQTAATMTVAALLA